MRYRVTRDADRDLEEIFLYWAKRASIEVSDRLIESITDRSGSSVSIRKQGNLPMK